MQYLQLEISPLKQPSFDDVLKQLGIMGFVVSLLNSHLSDWFRQRQDHQDYLIVSFKPFIDHLYIAFKFLKYFVMLPGDYSWHFAIFTDSDLYSAAAP